ncbi:hypothetical protein [Bacillus pseudomycoides]|uniref:hypothetical protein n=1 Tax=Bacillus pseudomycoides TaxID=64104 RepID=UPI001155B017|nr:hypothetical protein [Bacillus pseudomycoides]
MAKTMLEILAEDDEGNEQGAIWGMDDMKQYSLDTNVIRYKVAPTISKVKRTDKTLTPEL